MKIIIKITFFLTLLSFVYLSVYALLGNTDTEQTEYNIEIKLD
jgi:hypothetical protein